MQKIKTNPLIYIMAAVGLLAVAGVALALVSNNRSNSATNSGFDDSSYDVMQRIYQAELQANKELNAIYESFDCTADSDTITQRLNDFNESINQELRNLNDDITENNRHLGDDNAWAIANSYRTLLSKSIDADTNSLIEYMVDSCD